MGNQHLIDGVLDTVQRNRIALLPRAYVVKAFTGTAPNPNIGLREFCDRHNFLCAAIPEDVTMTLVQIRPESRESLHLYVKDQIAEIGTARVDSRLAMQALQVELWGVHRWIEEFASESDLEWSRDETGSNWVLWPAQPRKRSKSGILTPSANGVMAQITRTISKIRSLSD